MKSEKSRTRRAHASNGAVGPSTSADEWNMAFLFPDRIVEARERHGLVLLPLAPIEWHGPHMIMGTDPLLALAFARALASVLEAPYYPPLFLGTERERPHGILKAIGFRGDEHIEGMDFPANSVASGYCREEVFATVVREVLRLLLDRMGFSHVAIVNGHGAANQKEVLDRLCADINGGAAYRRAMWLYPGFPRSLIAGSIAHAGAEECSLMLAHYPGSVDLTKLPAKGRLKNLDHAIVDGETFDGKPKRGHVVRECQDPRRHTDADWGRAVFDRAVREATTAVRAMLKTRPRAAQGKRRKC